MIAAMLAVFTSRTEAQEKIRDEVALSGLDRSGTSGVFVSPSTGTLGAGQVSLGFAYKGGIGTNKLTGAYPIALSLGLMKNADATFSFVPISDPIQQEIHSVLGIKSHLFGGEAWHISGDVRLDRTDLPGIEEYSAGVISLSGRIIGSLSLGEAAMIQGNAGYLRVGLSTFERRDRFVGGLGVSMALGTSVTAGIEAYTLERILGTNGYGGWCGLKLLVLERLQFAAGVDATTIGGTLKPGVSIGLVLSTRPLRSFIEGDPNKPLIPVPPPLEELSSPDSNKNVQQEIRQK